MYELGMFTLRVVVSIILPIIFLQNLKIANNLNKSDLFKYKLRWGLIILFLFFIFSGAGDLMQNSDPMGSVSEQVLENSRNIKELTSFYTWIPLGFCAGIAIYGVSQIFLTKNIEDKTSE